MTETEGTILSDRYRVLRKLGEGGMAEVLLVEDLLENREVALKLLKAGEDASRDYFMHEFRLLSRLSHTNLVEVYDFGTAAYSGGSTMGVVEEASQDDLASEEGAPLEGLRCYYTCEYLRGQDLFEATADLDFDGLYAIVQQVLEALSFIHDRGLVHYDVKPENLNVLTIPASRPGQLEQHLVKLVDFGLSGTATTQRGAKIKGTVHYVAPEVAKSLPSDRRADLYSLGITLYYCATRKLPYDGGSAFSIIRKHIERIPVPPTELRADVPEAWAGFILRLIEKEPKDRYASAPEALADLSRRLGKPYQAQTSDRGGPLSPALVGRGEELRQLIDLLPTDPLADTHVVWIEGEEGIGKTRLIRELKVRAQLAGVPFLHAACVREGLQPFVRIIRHVQTLPVGRELAVEFAPALETLFPGVLEHSAEPFQIRDVEGLRAAIDQAVDFFIRLAKAQPFTLVLEDVRRANEITVSVLAMFLRALIGEQARGGDLPCLILLTDRLGQVSAETTALTEGIPEEFQAEISEDLSELRVQLSAARLLVSVPLFRLGKLETAELIGSMLALSDPPPRLVAKIHATAGGNPLFIEELVRNLMDEGVLALRQAEVSAEDLDAIKAPRSLAELLGQRLERLDTPARQALLALAVLGAPSPLRLIARAAEQGTDETLDALDTLVTQQMVLRPDDDGRGPPCYGLSHAQVRRTAIGSIDRTQLEAAHRAALAALESLYAGDEREEFVGRLARHAHESGELSQALEYAIRAGLQAQQRGNPQQAIELLDRGLEMLRWNDVIETAEEREVKEVVVLTRLSEVLATVGRYADATRALEELLALPRERLGEAAVWGRRRLGDLALRQGKVAEARRWLQEALEGSGQDVSLRGERARVLEVMSRIALWRGDYLKVISLAGEAVELFRALDREQDTLWALNILCTTEYYRGELRRSADHLRTCLRLVRGKRPDLRAPLLRIGLAEPLLGELEERLKRFVSDPAAQPMVRPAGDAFGLVISYSVLSTYVDLECHLETAVPFYEASIEAYRRRGDAHRTALAHNNLGVCLRHTGDLSRAREELETALAIHETSQDRQGGAVTLMNLGMLLLTLGDGGGAKERASRALAIARDIGIVWLTGHCHRVQGRVLALGGKLREADRELSRAAGVFRMVGNQRSLADLLLDRAEVALVAGQHDQATTYLARAAQTHPGEAPSDHRCRATLVEGGVSLAARDPSRAVELMERGLTLAQRSAVAELRLTAHRNLARANTELGALRLAQEQLDHADVLVAALTAGLGSRAKRAFDQSVEARQARDTARRLSERALDL
ncbi:MAG: tetratricopeptide repeat protein [Planctomycetes bacterium]|nr:tetratricopeptide repeat protein [Planctomycetota bacterium]